MPLPVIATKLYLPPSRPSLVPRTRLVDALAAGSDRQLTLISAPAGFGKTTLASVWVAGSGRPTAWLSLDEGDGDPVRFLSYVVAALGTIVELDGHLASQLDSPQAPPVEFILGSLLNGLAAVPFDFALVLDDYHLADAQAVDQILVFLLDHLPPRMHLVITTREDPALPLARLRARGQLTELRAAELRFTAEESARFLDGVMGLSLSAADVEALESRTEGWIAGLQLAAVSLQGQADPQSFIANFSGSHQFVLDYLLEEVLHQQSPAVQEFLVQTAILDRLCGPLCEALLADASLDGQRVLESIQRANLFIVPLDQERRWYRYHHLFSELLRQRLGQGAKLEELHRRASQWHEDNGFEIEAFRHAVAAHDVDRSERLMAGKGMPLQFRGAIRPVLGWLQSLPQAVLDARPSLWVSFASVRLASGQTGGIEDLLVAGEAALRAQGENPRNRDLLGQIAATRAMLAITRYDVATIITQSQLALQYLHPDNLPFRASTAWKLGLARQLLGERAAARQAYRETIDMCRGSGNLMFSALASTGLGNVQESDGELAEANRTYQATLLMVADQTVLVAVSESHLGLGRIQYQWDDLAAARRHGQESLVWARHLVNTDRAVSVELFLAGVETAAGECDAADARLAQAELTIKDRGFRLRVPDAVAARTRLLLRQGRLEEAARLVAEQPEALSLARVCLVRGQADAALAALEAPLREAEEKAWVFERLGLLVLRSLALHAAGQAGEAQRVLARAVSLAEPGGYVRLFTDEGQALEGLIRALPPGAASPAYLARLLAGFAPAGQTEAFSAAATELLSPRELEVLRLIAQGLSNEDIAERLFLALSTVKGHNQQIFGKLQVSRRTEAVARGRELGLLTT